MQASLHNRAHPFQIFFFTDDHDYITDFEGFGRQVRNQNPLDIHRIFYAIRTQGIFGGAQSGKYISVLGTLEWALWDLAGKALGVPMYRLLGGKFRDKCRVYRDSADASESKEVWA